MGIAFNANNFFGNLEFFGATWNILEHEFWYV